MYIIDISVLTISIKWGFTGARENTDFFLRFTKKITILGCSVSFVSQYIYKSGVLGGITRTLFHDEVANSEFNHRSTNKVLMV